MQLWRSNLLVPILRKSFYLENYRLHFTKVYMQSPFNQLQLSTTTWMSQSVKKKISKIKGKKLFSFVNFFCSFQDMQWSWAHWWIRFYCRWSQLRTKINNPISFLSELLLLLTTFLKKHTSFVIIGCLICNPCITLKYKNTNVCFWLIAT